MGEYHIELAHTLTLFQCCVSKSLKFHVWLSCNEMDNMQCKHMYMKFSFTCLQRPIFPDPLGGLYYTCPPTVHQILQCFTCVVFVYRFHCTSNTTVFPLGGICIQVPLHINYYNVSLGWSLYTGPLYIKYYSVSLGWSLYTGSTVHQLLQCVPWVVFVYRLRRTSTTLTLQILMGTKFSVF